MKLFRYRIRWVIRDSNTFARIANIEKPFAGDDDLRAIWPRRDGVSCVAVLAEVGDGFEQIGAWLPGWIMDDSLMLHRIEMAIKAYERGDDAAVARLRSTDYDFFKDIDVFV